MNILILVDLVFLLIISRIMYDGIEVFKSSSPLFILEAPHYQRARILSETSVVPGNKP